MNTAEPIRNPEELKLVKNYYISEEYHPRNQLLIIIGLNTALRISDILSLRWRDVYDFEKNCFRSHIVLTEQKTGKKSGVFMNKSMVDSLHCYKNIQEEEEQVIGEAFLLTGKNDASLSRIHAWRIVKHAAEQCHITGVISPHSLRKTFGYFAWKNGTPPAMLMNIFNHSSFEITKRYLGIAQDDKDEVYRNLCI